MGSNDILSGLVVEKIETIHDYIQIVFCNGSILCVFNRYTLDVEPMDSLKGKSVNCVREYDNEIIIEFEDAGPLTIGMEDSDFNGPEALVLTRDGDPPVVWS